MVAAGWAAAELGIGACIVAGIVSAVEVGVVVGQV